MSFPFSSFDTSDIDPKGVIDGYAVWSRNYDEMVTDNLDGPILERFRPHLSCPDMDILDLGCSRRRRHSCLLTIIRICFCAGKALHFRILRETWSRSGIMSIY